MKLAVIFLCSVACLARLEHPSHKLQDWIRSQSDFNGYTIHGLTMTQSLDYHTDGNGLEGYLIASISLHKTLNHVKSFVNHTDVHVLQGSTIVDRYLLVYNDPLSHNWVNRHFSDKATSPFVRIMRVPQPQTNHIASSLWPAGTCDSSPNDTERVSIDVVATVADSALGLGPSRVALSLLNAVRESHCKINVLTTSPRAVKMRLSLLTTSRSNSLTLRRNRSLELTTFGSCCVDVLQTLSSHPWTRWIEPEQQFSVLNHVATRTMQDPTKVSSDSARELWEKGITGTGQLVAIGDTGLDFDSCFFADPAHEVRFFPEVNLQHRKVVSYQQCLDEGYPPDHTDVYGGHGTHVSGSVAGNSLSANQDYNGMAKDAHIFFQDLTCGGLGGLLVPSDLEDYYGPAYNLGARISSNSWGGDHPTEYTTTDRLSDRFLFDHQEYLVVVAAGNSPMTGILSPSTSKNVLSVGAHLNSFDAHQRENLASFSAHGPSYDNRIKPDLCAPGSPVVSALSDGKLNSNQCTTTSRSGTSMATPLVAGSAALLRQYLTDGYMTANGIKGGEPFSTSLQIHHVKQPSAALMKALLIHAAVPMLATSATNTPNGMQGYGRLELNLLMYMPNAATVSALPALGSFRWFRDKLLVRTGQTHAFCFSLTGPRSPQDVVSSLRVTLAWIDSGAALEGSSHSLINDLDLAVVAQNGAVYKSSGEWDRTNNVEQVVIANPATLGSVFRIMVYGHEVLDEGSYGGQPFSLVVWGPGLTQVDEGDDNGPASCPANITTLLTCPNSCGGRGACVDGQCRCQSSFHHLDCSVCNASFLCNRNGVCSSTDTTCTCDRSGHFQDATCGACEVGWYGTRCDNTCACSSHGVCDTNGNCDCVREVDSSCYSGSQCQYCCLDHGGASCATPSFWCINKKTRLINATNQITAGLIEVNGFGKYENSQTCRWDLAAPDSNWQIQLTFEAFQIESPYDHLWVFDGQPDLVTSTPTSRIAQYTGTEGNGKVILSKGPFMQITFASDYAGPDVGFRIAYKFIPLATTTPMSTTTTATTMAPDTTLSVPSNTQAVTPSSAPTTTPSLQTMTTDPPQSTQSPLRFCSTLQDCNVVGTLRCTSSGICECKPLFVGPRCAGHCPSTISRDGSEVACGNAGDCVGPDRCRCTSDRVSTGSNCHLNVIDGTVALILNSTTSPIALGSYRLGDGSSTTVLSDSPVSFGQIWPLPNLSQPILNAQIDADSTGHPRYELSPGSIHYFIVNVSSPIAKINDNSSTNFSQWLLEHRVPRLRVWLLRPPESPDKSSVRPIDIHAWTNFKDAGSTLPLAATLVSPCIEFTGASSKSNTATLGFSWLAPAFAVRVPLDHINVTTRSHWFLRIQTFWVEEPASKDVLEVPQLTSCAADKTYLSDYTNETSLLVVYRVPPIEPRPTSVLITNQTIVSGEVDSHGVWFAIGSGMLGGLLVAALIAAVFAYKRRGFQRATVSDVDDEVDDIDDEHVLQVVPSTVKATSSLPPEVATKGSGPQVAQAALRSHTMVDAGALAPRVGGDDDESDDSDDLVNFPIQFVD